jgi:hypothetical protein
MRTWQCKNKVNMKQPTSSARGTHPKVHGYLNQRDPHARNILITCNCPCAEPHIHNTKQQYKNNNIAAPASIHHTTCIGQHLKNSKNTKNNMNCS